MFTGLIRQQGLLGARDATTLFVESPELRPRLAFGDSVAVNGVCLTVARLSDSGFGADLLPSTLKDTTLGELEAGVRLNLELPLAAADLLGGNLYHGVVDGTTRLLEHMELPGGALQLTFEVPQWLRDSLLPKGAICLDGVSLTVQNLAAGSFSVELVPTTQAETTLGTILPLTRVNVEADPMVKTVRGMLESMLAAGQIGAAPAAAVQAAQQMGAVGSNG